MKNYTPNIVLQANAGEYSVPLLMHHGSVPAHSLRYLVGRQLVNYINLEEEETEQLEAVQETEQLGAVQQETVQQETEQLEAVQQESGLAAREMEYSVPVQETGEL